jgi:hypothetical protein
MKAETTNEAKTEGGDKITEVFNQVGARSSNGYYRCKVLKEFRNG